jgi:hypothetical protein
VTCYFRHLGKIFEEAGITVTKENRNEVDMVIHGLVHTTYKDCPGTWREIKKLIAQDEKGFASALKKAWEAIKH